MSNVCFLRPFLLVTFLDSGHPALRPSGRLRRSHALLRVRGQAKKSDPATGRSSEARGRRARSRQRRQERKSLDPRLRGDDGEGEFNATASTGPLPLFRAHPNPLPGGEREPRVCVRRAHPASAEMKCKNTSATATRLSPHPTQSPPSPPHTASRPPYASTCDTNATTSSRSR